MRALMTMPSGNEKKNVRKKSNGRETQTKEIKRAPKDIASSNADEGMAQGRK